MSDHTKQARLDNWAMFVMSRLQVFFNTTDYCDLTLQFEGNVQLKVHRVIMNACTEYFRLLEQECDMDGDVLIMPPDLQADVILPIVNFMYTGILEYQHSIFERLYQTAELMNMTVLLKFLDAQRAKLKSQRVQHTAALMKRQIKTEKLPTVMPGRKLPVWKRKTAPMPVQVNPVKPYSPETRSIAGDVPKFDNAPRPTRFEWPDDDIQDIKPFDLLPLDSSFDSISYSSKPLMTQEEEMRSSCNSNVFDDLRQLPGGKVTKKPQGRDKDAYSLNSSVDMEDLKSYVKEQKIRSDLADYDDDEDPDDPDYVVEGSTERNKRKSSMSPVAAKKPKVSSEKENIVEIRAAGKVDHSKIISEVIKKYPHLMQKNKNIRLKILAKNKGDEKEKPVEKEKAKIKTFAPAATVKRTTPALKVVKTLAAAAVSEEAESSRKTHVGEQTWECTTCTNNGEPVEFVLYYLYRKHMTDAHQKQFDARECKHCGELYELPLQMTYHMYMTHAVMPPRSVNFPKCARCSFVAYDKDIMGKHMGFHASHSGHVQCPNCKLGFDGNQSLKAHMQLAGHNGKNQLSFDCQYCTRQLNSAMSLFVHCKTTHMEDAKKDGMLSLDDEHLEGQIALSESVDGAVEHMKITTQERHKMPVQTQPLEEATNIAPTLGSFDIVVLDDQQQYILQGEQDASAAITTPQSFMTLPSLQDQPYISQADIGSTDELVMVLTDHDYNDGSDDNIISTNDNSNIVVLYSHPVDGQQNQFITSQGNIMLNSETGMLEIHNDGVPMSTQSESIEMIQKEIQSSMSSITNTTESQSIVTSAMTAAEPAIDAIEEKCEKVTVAEVQEAEKLINTLEETETEQDTTDFGAEQLPEAFTVPQCASEPEPMDIDEEPSQVESFLDPPVAASAEKHEEPTTEAVEPSVDASTSPLTILQEEVPTKSIENQDPPEEMAEKDEISSVTASLTTIQHQHQPEAEVPQELLEPTSSESSGTPECATESQVPILAPTLNTDAETNVEDELINQTAHHDEQEYKTSASLSVSEQCPEEPMEVDGLTPRPESKDEDCVEEKVSPESTVPDDQLLDLNSGDAEKLDTPRDVVDGEDTSTALDSTESSESITKPLDVSPPLDDPPAVESIKLVEPADVANSSEPSEPSLEETMHEEATSEMLVESKSTIEETASLTESIRELPIEENMESEVAVAPPAEMKLQDTCTDALFENENQTGKKEGKDKIEGISTILNDWDDTDSQTSEQGSKAATVNKLINDWDDE